MSETINALLQGAASVEDRGFTFLTDDLRERTWSFAQLQEETLRRGRYLRSLGLERGDRVAMVVPDGQEFVLSFLGAVQAGIVPVPMYPPLALGKLDTYVETARKIIDTSGAKALLTSKQTAPILWSLVGKVPSLEAVHTVEKMAEHDPRSVKSSLDDLTIRSEDTCFLQFTSGSTSDPKGVVVTHANLVANARAIMLDGLDAFGERGDKGVSWLPLYHDMGLIGFVIAPLLTTVPIVFIPTLTFVKRPHVWMSTISKHRATITFAPNFAFGLAAKRATPKRLEGLDVSSLRIVGCGAEPINAATMRNFTETFAPAGFRPEALMPAYGMAEATLAIAFDDLTRPITTLRIDRDAYEAERQAIPTDTDDPARRIELVSCGRTFADHELGIMDANGELLPEGQVGEIVFSGPSVAAGYFRNEAATAASIVGKWLHTGDLGFIHDGEIYVSGRMKDLIILNGRNYYPQSIEWEVEHVEGVRRGNVVAFSTKGDDSEQLIVVAETKLREGDEKSALDETVRQKLQAALGVRARTVELLPPGALPKTSSGKLQRAKTKRMFEDGTLGREGVRTLGSNAARLALAKHLATSAVARLGHEMKKPARTANKWVRGRGGVSGRPQSSGQGGPS